MTSVDEPTAQAVANALSEWAWSWRPWWDEVTAQMRRWMIPPSGIGLAPVESLQIGPFRHWYLGIFSPMRAPRNRGLAIIDDGIRLGVLDEGLRRRFHDPTPAELWNLSAECWTHYIAPYLRRDDGSQVI